MYFSKIGCRAHEHYIFLRIFILRNINFYIFRNIYCYIKAINESNEDIRKSLKSILNPLSSSYKIFIEEDCPV